MTAIRPLGVSLTADVSGFERGMRRAAGMLASFRSRVGGVAKATRRLGEVPGVSGFGVIAGRAKRAEERIGAFAARRDLVQTRFRKMDVPLRDAAVGALSGATFGAFNRAPRAEQRVRDPQLAEVNRNLVDIAGQLARDKPALAG